MRLYYRIMRGILVFIVHILFRIKIKGRENIPDKNFILAANHQSFWDPVLLAIAIPRELHFVAKNSLFENKFVGALIKSLNAFPIDRDGTDIKAIRNSVNMVKDGNNLCIFPEGTRVHDKKRSNLKEGVGLIAVMAKHPVLPVSVIGNRRLFRSIEITIHPIIDIEKLAKEESRKNLRNKLLDQLYYCFYGEEGINE